MPAALEVIILAVGLLAFFALSGWVLLRLLAPSLPVDVTAALAPVVGVATFSALAAFVMLRLPRWRGIRSAKHPRFSFAHGRADHCGMSLLATPLRQPLTNCATYCAILYDPELKRIIF